MIFYLLLLLQAPFIIRFHYEFSSVNPYHRSMIILRQITSPFVIPLKELLGVKAGKYASILVAFLITLVFILLLPMNTPIQYKLVLVFWYFFEGWLKLARYALVLTVILSFIATTSSSAGLKEVYYFFHHFTDPFLSPIRRIIPAFGGFDFSPIIAFFAFSFIERLLVQIIIMVST